MMKNITVLTFDEVLAEHLSKHIIPIPITMIVACKLAIECAVRGEFDTQVELPYNVIWRDIETWKANKTAKAWDIIQWCHLDKFI